MIAYMNNTERATYKVTYFEAAPWNPSRVVVMEGLSGKREQNRLEKALARGVKDGLVESWEKVEAGR
jgi:hypothetical protein